jgi:hypothetical protein
MYAFSMYAFSMYAFSMYAFSMYAFSMYAFSMYACTCTRVRVRVRVFQTTFYFDLFFPSQPHVSREEGANSVRLFTPEGRKALAKSKLVHGRGHSWILIEELKK